MHLYLLHSLQQTPQSKPKRMSMTIRIQSSEISPRAAKSDRLLHNLLFN